MDPSVEVRHVEAAVTGRCLIKNAAGPKPAPLLVGFHGYGENAERHLTELDSLPGGQSWIRCGVQALHPFYNRRSNEVVASWMTRLDREQAIIANRAYVRAAVEQICGQLSWRPPLILAGFSQGTSMAYRAAAVCPEPVAGLVILAGDLPPELTAEEIARFGSVLIGRGSGDQWYDEATMRADIERLEAAGIRVTPCVFEGGHEWTPAFREAAGNFLARLDGS